MSRKQITFIVIGSIVGVLLLVAFMLWSIPMYRVWQKELSGRAVLKEAEWSRQVRVEEANAEYEAAKLLRKAEVERARGVAESIGIVGDSLENNEAYIRYRWVEGLHNDNGEIIYVPTEANLPILEAGRFGKE